MTIHTIWGDFESEEELIRTGAKMMGISYKEAEKIRKKALKEHENERKKIENAIQKRKHLEQSILNKIKAKFPDMHFKPCPWCGEEPHIEVSVSCNYWVNEKQKPKSYRVELHSCEHLNKTGSYLNSYPIDQIPESPTYANSDVTWTGSWEDHGWQRAVDDYKAYLSNDYPRKCAGCGKKWRGYEDYDVPNVDGKDYCGECFKARFNEEGEKYARADMYRDIRNLSTMWDNGPMFYTSFRNLMEHRGLTDHSKITVEHKDVGIDKMASSRMSGDIRGDRYEIFYEYSYGKHMVAYVWKPNDLEELEKYLKSF